MPTYCNRKKRRMKSVNGGVERQVARLKLLFTKLKQMISISALTAIIMTDKKRKSIRVNLMEMYIYSRQMIDESGRWAWQINGKRKSGKPKSVRGPRVPQVTSLRDPVQNKCKRGKKNVMDGFSLQ